jgi:5'-3' exonuclease
MQRIALLDGDIIGYRSAASCNPTKSKPFLEPLDTAIQRADELCWRILTDVDSSEYEMYLGGSENFRKQIDPEYKANRKSEKPQWLEPVREFLIEEWQAKVCGGYETDDALSMRATELGPGKFVICSIDKDLKQIPGDHYNFVKLEHFTIDIYQAAKHFWASMLIGDTADNIRGVDGLGQVKAYRALEGLDSEEFYDKVREIYNDDDRFTKNMVLLHLLCSREEWHDVNHLYGLEPLSTATAQD